MVTKASQKTFVYTHESTMSAKQTLQMRGEPVDTGSLSIQQRTALVKRRFSVGTKYSRSITTPLPKSLITLLTPMARTKFRDMPKQACRQLVKKNSND